MALSLLLLACGESVDGIAEGPYLQLASETSVVVIWFAPGHGEMDLVLGGAEAERTVRVAPRDGKFRVALTGLPPGSAIPYRILENGVVRAESVLHTHRPAGSSFTFAVFGDSGSGSREQFDLAARITRAEPDFVIHTGDIVYPEGSRSGYREKFFLPYRDLISRVVLWPCVGNHDLKTPEGFLDVFELPRNGPDATVDSGNYYFDYGKVRFAFVNSDLKRGELRDEAAPWLQRVLSEEGPEFRFVVCHRPPYASRAEPYRSRRIQDFLVPVYEKCGVDAVFCGHRHFYERLHSASGVVHIITGGGGGDLDRMLPVEERPTSSRAGFDEETSFTLVTIEKGRMRLRQISGSGREVDRWEAAARASKKEK